MNVRLERSLDDPNRVDSRQRMIAEWWSELRICGESGATTWEDLELLEREVTDCLALDPPDVCHAESLTALAMLRISGCSPDL